MNSRGFFCFILLFAFVFIELDALSGLEETRAGLARARASAFEAERLSLQRSLLEESVDNVVEGALEEGLAMELGPGRIKELVNSRLAMLFEEAESSYAGLELGPEAVSAGFLNSNSSVMVTRLGRKNVEASYFFSGGITRENPVIARLRGNEFGAEFRVPAGYAATSGVVG